MIYEWMDDFKINNQIETIFSHFHFTYKQTAFDRMFRNANAKLKTTKQYDACSVESEHIYAKSLSKTASKLNKACRDVPGTLADAWRNVAAEMESRSEVHRQFSATMTKEIVKPLKQLLENQNKARKLVRDETNPTAIELMN